jgi:hypothetical protein
MIGGSCLIVFYVILHRVKSSQPEDYAYEKNHVNKENWTKGEAV